MKTLNLNILKNSLTVSVIVSVLSFASCKKDDMIVAPKGPLISGTERQNNVISGIPVSADQYDASQIQLAVKSVMFRIDHLAARSSAADYAVSVKFDGTVIFEGRRNVAYIGSKEWKLDTHKFLEIKNLFALSGFNSIEDKLSLMADVPMVSTSWCASPKSISKTLIDYYDNYPVELIRLRERAEALLYLQELIIIGSRTEVVNSTSSTM